MNVKIMEVVPAAYMGRAMSVWLALSMIIAVIIYKLPAPNPVPAGR